MADEKPKTVGDLLAESGSGVGAFASLFAGGAVAMGKLAEWEHTVCSDCAMWAEREPGWGTCGPQNDGPGSNVRVLLASTGPLWPGCRGFVLRDGAPGPAKRAHEAAKKRIADAMGAGKEKPGP